MSSVSILRTRVSVGGGGSLAKIHTIYRAKLECDVRDSVSAAECFEKSSKIYWAELVAASVRRWLNKGVKSGVRIQSGIFVCLYGQTFLELHRLTRSLLSGDRSRNEKTGSATVSSLLGLLAKGIVIASDRYSFDCCSLYGYLSLF